MIKSSNASINVTINHRQLFVYSGANINFIGDFRVEYNYLANTIMEKLTINNLK